MAEIVSRQHDQVYTNRHGPPIGRPGNGLGDVWGGVDEGSEARKKRLSSPFVLFELEVEPEDDHLDELHEAIGRLTARQAFVIRLRYGLVDGVAYTLREIASFMGVTHQAASDLEQRALATLQKLVTDG